MKKFKKFSKKIESTTNFNCHCEQSEAILLLKTGYNIYSQNLNRSILFLVRIQVLRNSESPKSAASGFENEVKRRIQDYQNQNIFWL